jgi:hypothetical protein
MSTNCEVISVTKKNGKNVVTCIESDLSIFHAIDLIIRLDKINTMRDTHYSIRCDNTIVCSI